MSAAASPTGAPAWLRPIAALDDDAVAALANPGLLRRAGKLLDAVVLISADDQVVELSCEQWQVRLLPAGPQAARCPCPVAGVCVHVVACWLWARTAGIAESAPEVISSSEASGEPSPPTAAEAVLTPSSEAPGGAEPPVPPAPRLTPGQRQVAREVTEVIERLVATGIAQLGTAAIDRLARTGQRTRLEKLPLLARLIEGAAGRLRALARRDDAAGETACLSALAQAWALAVRLADDTSAVPNALLGNSSGQNADLGTLMPLAVRWWTSASRSRGLTFHAFDLDRGRLEEATTGRAASADPGFSASWESPLLWGASPAHLCSGVLRLAGAERRDDATLSPTTRTRVEAQPWDDLDLDALADAVNGQSHGPARVTFGATPQPLRLIRPRTGFDPDRIELDEVGQQLVWALTDADGTPVRLALPATEHHARVLTWLIEKSRALAITVVGDRPEAVFLPGPSGPQLVSLTLSPLPLSANYPSWLRRIRGLDQQHRADGPLREPGDLERLTAACAEVVEALASSGRPIPSPRQSATLTHRVAQADDLGLTTLAAAIRALLAPSVTPADLLWARFVLDRIEALLP